MTSGLYLVLAENLSSAIETNSKSVTEISEISGIPTDRLQSIAEGHASGVTLHDVGRLAFALEIEALHLLAA